MKDQLINNKLLRKLILRIWLLRKRADIIVRFEREVEIRNGMDIQDIQMRSKILKKKGKYSL